MYGIHTSTKEQINRVVSDLFDKAALRLVGSVPKLHNKKHTLIGFESSVTLASLFVMAMGNRYLNNTEQDVLKGILEGAYSYVDVLKNKTSNNITQRIEGIARESRISGEKIPEVEIGKIIQEELGKAKSGLETIMASEGTKTRNLGSVMEITRQAAYSGDSDPTIAFYGSNNNSTCKECRRLFFMPDGTTPRLWKLSECNGGYFKRGDSVPSILGLHPRCTHTPVNIPKDYGFDKKGHITFVGSKHNELDKQREAV